MKIIDNYRREVGDKYTLAPNLPKQHELRLVNFFNKCRIKSIEYQGYKYFTRKDMVSGPTRIKFERIESYINLHRIRRKSDRKYAFLNKKLEWDWTENKYEGLTCDSWDSVRIFKTLNRDDLFLENICN